MNNIQRTNAVSKEVKTQWVMTKAFRDKTYQTFKALDLEKWINEDDKLRQYELCTFRSNNPLIFFYSKDHIHLS